MRSQTVGFGEQRVCKAEDESECLAPDRQEEEGDMGSTDGSLK